MNGGYDEGYRACPCFWGTEPGSLVKTFAETVLDLSRRKILDLGCGEGKNAYYLSDRGADVLAVDCSELALKNAKGARSTNGKITWALADARALSLEGPFDAVILYGLLHCLSDEPSIRGTIERAQASTEPGGYNVVCTFNSRSHPSLGLAHPGFSPCLLHHDYFCAAYRGWELLCATDCDLVEMHPQNNVPHSHSLTRLIARRPAL